MAERGISLKVKTTLHHTTIPDAAMSGANAIQYNHDLGNNRRPDELCDNADVRVGLSWMDKAKRVTIPETALNRSRRSTLDTAFVGLLSGQHQLKSRCSASQHYFLA